MNTDLESAPFKVHQYNGSWQLDFIEGSKLINPNDTRNWIDFTMFEMISFSFNYVDF